MKKLCFYGTTTSKIIHIPKSIKTPKLNYVEPTKWNLTFDRPSQVKSRAFIDLHDVFLGPAKNICKHDNLCDYKNPEYYAYHTYSYNDIERDLFCKRCRTQPSSLTKSILQDSNEKVP